MRKSRQKQSRFRVNTAKQLDELIKRGLVKPSDQVIAKAALKRRKNCQESTHQVMCSLVPCLPANVLYQTLVRKYGRYHNGGEVVFELRFNRLGRRWRLDMAMPRFKLGIEMDGWEFHGKYLSGFQRDRAKSLWFERRGWRVIRVSNEQVRYQLSDICTAIEEILSFCKCEPASGTIVQVAFDYSEYIEEDV